MSNLWARAKQCRVIVSVAMLSVLLALVAGCGDGNSGGGTPAPATQATGMVTGQVVSSANNAPVGVATVKTDSGTTTTAADGKFSVSAPAADRTIVRVEANGFADAFPVAQVKSGQTTNLGVKLVPVGVTAPLSVTSGGTVSNSIARVTIPANSLVPQAGGTPAGSVTVSLTPLNPAVDMSLMPGGFNGIPSGGGSTQPIESFGALLIDIRDSAGTRYTLAQGQTASIRIPVATQSSSPPTTIPLWFFDEVAGVWREEGTARLQGSGSNRYYEGDITRVAYWNADYLFDSIVVNGCVKDANGQVVANARVETRGIDYIGTADVLTAANGTFSVAMRPNSQANLSVMEFDLQTFALVSTSNIVKVTASTTDISLTNCLVKQPGPLAITTTALPAGTVGVAYNQTLAASGGVPGYVWSLNAGSNPLPVGLTLNPAGVISGTPTADGTKTITIKVMDSTNATKTKEFTLAITKISTPPPPPPPPPSLTITTTVFPSGIVGTAYTAIVEATGGTGNMTWSVSSGTLPDGLKLDAASGNISGTPTTAGTFPFTVQVHDSGTPQQSAQQPLTIVIVASGGGGGTGGGSGQLTVSNAPASVEGKFVADPKNTLTGVLPGGSISLDWIEAASPTLHAEILEIIENDPTHRGIQYSSLETATNNGSIWKCAGLCPGLTISRSAGTATFVNVVLEPETNATQSITLNGTLTFTPF